METPYGNVHVAIQGDRAKPAILTFHDIGLNRKFHTSSVCTCKLKIEIENCTILIPKGNSYCRRKSSARGPRFKVSSIELSAEIDIPLRSPIQVQTKAKVA